MQPSDEIKSKLDIVDVIRDYIPLKAAGVNFRALCPFHHEKSPSFVVSPEKQIWHCFGCSKGGDLISFVMEMEGLSFVEGLRHLASKAGVVLKKENPQLSSQRNRLLDIMEFAVKYYHKMLLENPEAGAIREYLTTRGLTEETIEEWQIGYSPDSWDDLINLLKAKGYKENEIFSAGLSVQKEGASRFYNRFRGRVMFPINDINGNAVAFSARVNPEKEKEEKMGKYINSPGTLIYDKSKILFCLDKAKQEIKKRDLAIVVEGQMDAITAHQEGYKNTVASSGTALTGEQVLLLKRYSPNIALSFDMDKAGEMAAERGIRETMKAEMNAKIISLPKGDKDPDECIKNNKAGWEEAVKNAKPVMEYYFDKTFAPLDLEKEEDKRKAVKILLPVLAQLGNKMEQDFWLKKLSQTVNTREEILLEALNKFVVSPVSIQEENEKKFGQEKLSREEMLSELLIALMLKFPPLIEYALNHIQPDQVAGQEQRTLYNGLIIYYNNVIDNWTQEGGESNIPQVNFKEFRQWFIENRLNKEGREVGESEIGDESGDSQLKLLDKLALLGDKDFYNYEIEQAKNEIIKIIVHLKKNYLGERREEIKKLIAQAEKEGDEENIKGLMEEFKALSDEIREIEILT